MFACRGNGRLLKRTEGSISKPSVCMQSQGRVFFVLYIRVFGYSYTGFHIGFFVGRGNLEKLFIMSTVYPPRHHPQNCLFLSEQVGSGFYCLCVCEGNWLD